MLFTFVLLIPRGTKQQDEKQNLHLHFLHLRFHRALATGIGILRRIIKKKQFLTCFLLKRLYFLELFCMWVNKNVWPNICLELIRLKY